jgi:hypothetical protein
MNLTGHETTRLLAAIRMATLTMKAEVSATRFRMAGKRLADLFAKANFDPNQPRVPRGSPTGGRWTDNLTGGQAATRHLAGGSGSDDLDKPTIPRQRPPTAKARNTFVKEAARWIFRGGKVALRVSPIGRAIDVVEVGIWLWDHWPYIEAYQDEPKTLEELQRAVSKPKAGYDIHHIVERAAARKAGYTREEINAPENLVRIPTLKHWELNAWYETRNANYGFKTPREYLSDTTLSRETRFEVGKDGLRAVGVLAQ